MKLILHIGTSKTGTTALQYFLYANAKKLRERRIYYAVPPNQFNFNSVTNSYLLSGTDNFQAFFLHHLRAAERDGAHTIIASSENLYLIRYLARFMANKSSADALSQERNLIERLRASIPAKMECRVLCYVRRPDHWLESMYNQNVKRGVLFTGDVLDFLNTIEDSLDYHHCLSIWREVFGSSACLVRVYESALPNLIDDFMKDVVGIEYLSAFVRPYRRANERLSRDVLEYKRLKNEHILFSERRLERKIYALVDRRVTNPDNNHEYLSPDERADLLSRLEPSMRLLQAEFSLPPFPQLDLDAARATWQPYPGLALEKRKEIEFHYNAVQGRMGFRLERILRRWASFTRRRLPFLSLIFDFARGSGIRRLLLEATNRFQ
ncbi:hypothetical protein [Mesorhizobium muleiense]|uniref:Sulfotransferase family protein n=1 Tax=Mesorhizobium muleiense TaxID=1004279 RepID=A0A1G8I3R5_9HYPH|nr:hypothetical protein [Mesorhizobium muleiense]MCF6099550.1 hypothetical protein [Mesorhizobium muleiense]SDI13391.1 hypothetical protein SAMN05428953_101247 [Mesorhizobium muleiense]